MNSQPHRRPQACISLPTPHCKIGVIMLLEVKNFKYRDTEYKVLSMVLTQKALVK